MSGENTKNLTEVNMQPARQRVYGLDIIKSMAMLFVISLHTVVLRPDFMAAGNGRLSHIIQYALKFLVEGVPLFVMVNGFLLLGMSTWDLKKYLRRCRKLFILLIIWAVILVTWGTFCAGEELTFRGFMECFLDTEDIRKYVGVLWYLENLLAVYMVFPVLKLLFDQYEKLFKWVFTLVAIFSVGVQTLILMRDAFALVANPEYFTRFITVMDRFNPTGNAYYVYCFMLGGLVYMYREKLVEHRRKFMLLGVCSWLLVTVICVFLSFQFGGTYNERYNHDSIFMTGMMLGFMAAFLPCENKGRPLQKLITNYGSNTLGVYLIHYPVIYAYNALVPAREELIYRLIEYVFTVVVSYLLVLLLKQIPYVKKLVS